MQIVDALAKLGFSFWQIVFLIAILMFRRELKELIQKVTSLKVAGSEITWNQKNDTVAVLSDVKAELEGSTTTDPATIALIDKKIHNRLILALSDIKRSTTYLWPALVNAKVGARLTIPIRRVTLERIQTALETLRGSGIVQFDTEVDWSQSNVEMLVIQSVSAELVSLVAEADAL